MRVTRHHKAKLALLTLLGVSCAAISAPGQAAPSEDTKSRLKLIPGYLPKDELPNARELLGPPPAADSAAQARDEEVRRAALPLRDTPRWTQAQADANLVFPQPAQNFSCAMGIEISEGQTPHVYQLMRRVLTDAGLSTYSAKQAYNRTRPFAAHDESTCLPQHDAALRSDGSYPSGHTAVGWAWALVLAQINPAQADALFARGLAFGQSRVICDAHWQSDVDAGRTMGAATVALLNTSAEFLADVAAARQEVEAAKASASAPPAATCAAEQAALALP